MHAAVGPSVNISCGSCEGIINVEWDIIPKLINSKYFVCPSCKTPQNIDPQELSRSVQEVLTGARPPVPGPQAAPGQVPPSALQPTVPSPGNASQSGHGTGYHSVDGQGQHVGFKRKAPSDYPSVQPHKRTNYFDAPNGSEMFQNQVPSWHSSTSRNGSYAGLGNLISQGASFAELGQRILGGGIDDFQFSQSSRPFGVGLTAPGAAGAHTAEDDEEEEDEDGQAGETFQEYTPSKCSLGVPHPDPVVESSSLAAAEPPDIAHKLKMQDAIEKGVLSSLQLETICYACQCHERILPDGKRAGFFIGDGAGVGKGRTIAGLILENWKACRKRHVWVSVSADLKHDARRDLDDVDAIDIPLHQLSKMSYGKLDTVSRTTAQEGVMFVTYSTLIAANDKGRTRLKQLLDWCGEDFDGLIVFDECHKAKNLVPKLMERSTKTGKAVLKLQQDLPDGRVVYCSATGASELKNMGYMVRLGLWGPASPSFPDFPSFVRAVGSRGVGALELVAMDMKSRGMYLCRTLSFAHAEFETCEIELEEEMKLVYKKACELVSGLYKEFLYAVHRYQYPTMEDKSKKFSWSLFWGAHQRFFKSLCMAAKVPATVRLAKKALKEGKCVIIGLQSTGEARTTDVVNERGTELEDFAGMKETLLKFIENHYPLPEVEEIALEEFEEEEIATQCNVAMSSINSSSDEGSTRGDKEAKVRWPKKTDKDANGADESVSPSGDGTTSDEKSTQQRNRLTGRELGNGGQADGGVPNRLQAGKEVPSGEESTTSEEPQNNRSSSSPETGAEGLKPSSSKATTVLNNARSQTTAGSGDEVIEIDIEDERGRKPGACSTGCQPPQPPPRPKPVPQDDMYAEAMERRRKVLENVERIDLPVNPLDELIDQLGGPTKVAEMTGRKCRLTRNKEGERKGKVTYQSRGAELGESLENVNIAEQKAFMSGKKLVAIISDAASAGISLQADRRCENQLRRVHLTLELPWSAEKAIQQFGRSHRSNQVSCPEYKLLFTSLGGEKRFVASVARRLLSLGALTQGDRRAGVSFEMCDFNYDSTWGRRALNTMYMGLMEECTPIVAPSCVASNMGEPNAKYANLERFRTEMRRHLFSVGIIKPKPRHNEQPALMLRDIALDLIDPDPAIGSIPDGERNNVPHFLNRLLGMVPTLQCDLFGWYQEHLDATISRAKKEGRYDTGIVDVQGTRLEMQGPPQTVFVDRLSGGRTLHYQVHQDRGVSWMDAVKMLKEHLKAVGGADDGRSGFYRNKPGAHRGLHMVLALYDPDSSLPRFKMIRPLTGAASKPWKSSELKQRYIPMEDEEMAQELWDDVYNAAGRQKFRVKQLNILAGVILPIWGVIDRALGMQHREHDKLLQVRRLQMTNSSQRLVGVLVPESAMHVVLEGLEELNAANGVTADSPSLDYVPDYDDVGPFGTGVTAPQWGGRHPGQEPIELLDE